MLLKPAFEENGCKFYGSGGYIGSSFHTELGDFLITEIISYYDVPLIMMVENINKDVYIASICLDDDGDLSNSYVLSKQTDLDNLVTDLTEKGFSISKFFEGITEGYKIDVTGFNSLDVITVINPSDKKYNHY